MIQYNAEVACLLGDGAQSIDPEKIKQKSSS
jgi:hypothetical protein